MPIKVDRDDSHHRLVWTASDPVSLADWRTVLADQAESGLWTYSTLLDARAVRSTQTLFGLSDVSGLIRALTETYDRHGPMAVIVRNVQSVKDAGLFGFFAADLPFTAKLFSTTQTKDASAWLATHTHLAIL